MFLSPSSKCWGLRVPAAERSLCPLLLGNSLLEPRLSPSPCQGISPEGDTDPEGGLDLEEFTRYLQEREQRLLLMFHSLDRNQDGKASAGRGMGPMGLALAAPRRGQGCLSLMTHQLFLGILLTLN